MRFFTDWVSGPLHPPVHPQGVRFLLSPGSTRGRSQNLPKHRSPSRDAAELTQPDTAVTVNILIPKTQVCVCSVTWEGWLGLENKQTFLQVDRCAGQPRPGSWETA